MQENIVEIKICKQCNCNFEITNKDFEFYDKISPIFDWKKYLIPAPSLCPKCREQRRMTYRNERKLYKRENETTWKSIITIYSPNSPYKIFDNKYWWGDEWDAIDYWQEIDFDKSIFEQIQKLRLKVPRLTNNLTNDEWVTYSNQIWQSKNVYLSYNWWYLEDCMYSNELVYSKNIVDCLEVKNSQNLYECFLSNKCYNSFYLEKCDECNFSYFSYDCKWSNNIFLCTNLRNKSYCIKNKQYSKEEYKIEVSKLLNWEYSNIIALKNEFNEIKLKAIHNENSNNLVENSLWDYITEANNCNYCYNIYKSENCKYVSHWDADQKNCYDMNYIAEIDLWYEWIMVAWYKNLFSYLMVYWKNNFYCDLCIECEDCFWCVWLRHKKYCIFNKQYTKEEYEKLVVKIIEKMLEYWEWWEFFPVKYSPFAYNETVAQEYYPLKKEEALEKWFNWIDYENPTPKVEKIIPANKLPENINAIPDDILNWAIECELTKKPFRIISQELEFYRNNNLPIPRRHPDIRHLDRMKLRNPRILYDKKCDKCWINIKTTYQPDREEIVYCEKCYNSEIY